MNDYGTTLRKHRRQAILRFLKECDGYGANSSIPYRIMNAKGLMREQGLITLADLGGLLLATATTRGVEVAQGIASHPDVQRPSPRA